MHVQPEAYIAIFLCGNGLLYAIVFLPLLCFRWIQDFRTLFTPENCVSNSGLIIFALPIAVVDDFICF